MQSSCVDMLAAVGMAAAVDAAAATCPPPPLPCGTFPEFLQYMDEVGQTLDTVLLQRNPAISEEVAALFRGEAFENINVEF